MYTSSQGQLFFLKQIQEKREEMCLYGMKYGLNAAKTIACSRELDILLNEYYRQFQAPKSRRSSNIPRKAVTKFYVNQQKLRSAK